MFYNNLRNLLAVCIVMSVRADNSYLPIRKGLPAMFSFTVTSAQAVAITRFLRLQDPTQIYAEIVDGVVQLACASRDSWVQVTGPESVTDGKDRHLNARRFLPAMNKVASSRISDMDAPVTVTLDDNGLATLTGPCGTVKDADIIAPAMGWTQFKDVSDSYSLAPADRETVWRIAQATDAIDTRLSLEHGFNVDGDIVTSDRFMLARGKVALPKELADTSIFYLGLFKLMYGYRRALADVDIAFTKQGQLVFDGMVFSSKETTSDSPSFGMSTRRDSVARLADFGKSTNIVGAGVLPRTLASVVVDAHKSMDVSAEVSPLEGYDFPNLYMTKKVMSQAFRVVDSREIFEERAGFSTISRAVMTSEGTNTGNETIRMMIMPAKRVA